MATTVVDYKTFRPDMMSPGGWVLDGGCLGFQFAIAMNERCKRVLAVDPTPGLYPPPFHRVVYRQVALVGTPCESIGWVKNAQAECSHTDEHLGRRVPAKTISQLMVEHKIKLFDLVKLNVEGAEYDILKHWPGPIARQISVSFHEFIPGRNPDPKHYFPLMLAHLAKWYDVAQHEWTNKYEDDIPVGNYWDSLFILRT